MAKRPRGRRSPLRRFLPSLGIVGLVALAALDVFLVAAAIDHVRPEPAPGSDRGAPSAVESTPSSSPSAGDSPSASSSPSPRSSPAEVPSGPLLLAQAPDGTLLRATLGGCTDDADPEVAVSTDQGATFRALPVAPDLDGVLAVEATGRRSLQLVGADATCTAQAYTGGARTRSWQSGPIGAEWHLMLSGADTVHSPDGVVETPCTPGALSTVGSVRLLCEDGRVLGTADAGQNWATLGRLPNATAFAFDGPNRGYALVTRQDCPTAVMTTTDGGASWTFADCLDGDGRAIAARGDVVTALVDDQVLRSEDGAETWQEVS